jgi:septal ring factor EnvC (AmiA/AmiB activator)
MPPQDEPPSDGGSSGIAWKIATGVSVFLLIGALVWGFLQKQDADTAAAASAAEIEQLQAKIAEDEKQDAALQAELEKAQAAHDKVEQKLKVKEGDLSKETANLKNLESQYNKAQKEANAKQATLRDQLAAQQAKTALATKCAQVMATGMQIIYNAATPEEVMNDVTKEMNRAAASCDGVVNVG